MTIIGNIFLALASLIFFVLVSIVISREPPRGGDAVMGYGWDIIIFNLVFLGCMLVVAFIIGWKGGFAWVASSGGSRFFLVGFGLVSAVFTAALSQIFKGESGEMPILIRLLSGFAPLLIPILLLAGSAILLNDGQQSTIPAAAYQWPLIIAVGLGGLGVGGSILWWIVESNRSAVRKMEGAVADQARYHQNFLDDIDSCDVTKNMVSILVLTDANHDVDVREKAVAKIKTHPDWQKEMIRLLECDWAPEAFTFLASNEVDDKNLFIEPVRKGVLIQAKLIRKDIRETSNLYADMFYWQLDRMLRMVDKFEELGASYLPEVREVRAALDEPTDFTKPGFHCTRLLDAWIKKHS